jgi:O-acetylhomoserine/O-acetylserine sulfhydrylase-like pyridoxal-dependent enzyme
MTAAEAPSEAVQLAQATIAVHGGVRPLEQAFGAVVSPFFHSATFSCQIFDKIRRYARGELRDAYFYLRYANPTVDELEWQVAKLEGAAACVVTASGSAATFCALAAACESGDEVVASESIYGGTTKNPRQNRSFCRRYRVR